MRRVQKVAELNLLPVMNMVTILIPLLLMGAQLMNLAVVDTTLPAICSDCDTEPRPDRLNLSLAITPGGLQLLGVDSVIADPMIPCESGGCRGLESYDLQTLSQHLITVKAQWPEAETLILVPDERVPYEVLIAVMDAARESPGHDTLFPFVTIAGGA